MFTVSQSKIKTWRRCHHSYYYKYILMLRRKRKSRPLMRGSVIHDMLEAATNKLDQWKVYKAWVKKNGKLFKEEVEEYGDVAQEVKLLMEAYFDHYKKDKVKPVKNDGRWCEYPFEVPLCKGINLKGRIDGVGKSPDKRDWLIEHKSHKTIPVSEFKYTDVQAGLYTWVAPQLGFPEPDGVMWNYIRAKTPAIPELLKKGDALSKRANIDTMWPVYLAEVKKHGFKPKDYADMKKILEGKESSFFSRIYLPVNKTFISNLMEETIFTAKEIKRRGGKDTTRTVDKHCEWCDYQPLCQAQLLGLDTKFMMKAEYVKEKGNKKHG